MPDERDRDVPPEQEQEDVTDLPEREAMSLLPSSLIGGLGSSTPIGGSLLGGSTTPPADPSQASAPITVPQMPVPTENPGPYTPEATATNET